MVKKVTTKPAPEPAPPEADLGEVFELIGSKGAIYRIKDVAECDRHIQFITLRIKRWRESSRFQQFVEPLIADRDLILEYRSDLTSKTLA